MSDAALEARAGSSPAGSLPAGSLPAASRTWLALVYCSLTLMTGATSFGSRLVSVYAAAELHRRAWELVLRHGSTGGDSVLSGVNVQVYARRPLMLAVVEGVSDATGIGWPKAFALVRLLSIGIAYVLLRRLYRLWLDELGALAGCFFVAAAAAFTFVTNRWEILSDFPELALFAAALHAVCRGRPLAATLITLVGSFNRETMGFIVAFAAAEAVWGTRRRENLLAAAGALAAWLAASGTIYAWMVPIQGVDAYVSTVRHNLRGLAALRSSFHPYNNFLYPLYLLGPFWVLPLLRWRMLPPCLRSYALAAPVFMVVIVFRGAFNEPRELLLLLTVMVPAGLIALFGPSVSSTA